jgi:tetratricopeptide (TPR) repeat protein
MKARLVVLGACLVLFLPEPAFAQSFGDGAVADGATEAEARALFAAGREAFDGGRYAVALSRWQESYKLSKRPELLYNLGLAYDRLRRDDEAVMAFEAFVTALPNDANVPEVRSRIQAIRDARAEPAKPDPTPAPTPAAAAASVPLAKTYGPAQQEQHSATDTDANTPWYAEWYTWAGVGGVVVAAVVVGLVASSSDEVVHARPKSGVTVQALRGAP